MNSEIDYPAEYDNSARVENSAELVDKYITDAANYREFAAERTQLDLNYGDRDRNKMDIFWPDSEAGKSRKCPIVMFIHGGYWQRLDRSCFSHLSAGLNAHGIAVAMPSYTLCPHIKIGGIINEMRRACLVLFQTFRRRITVVGHSAGGHLAACMMATDWQEIHPRLPHDLVASGLGISGLYDLLPLRQTPVNDALGMDEEQALSASPVHWVPQALQRFDAWVGATESNEYHRQSRDLASRWNMLATPTRYISVPGANHFTIVDELVKPGSPMVQRIVELVKRPATEAELPALDEEEVELLLNLFIDASMADEEEQVETAQAKEEPEETVEESVDGSDDQAADAAGEEATEAQAIADSEEGEPESDEPDDDKQAEPAESSEGEDGEPTETEAVEDIEAADDTGDKQAEVEDYDNDEAEEGVDDQTEGSEDAPVKLVATATLTVPEKVVEAPETSGSAEEQPKQPANGDQADAAPQEQAK